MSPGSYKGRVVFLTRSLGGGLGGLEQHLEELMRIHNEAGYFTAAITATYSGKSDTLNVVQEAEFWKSRRSRWTFEKICGNAPDIVNLHYVPRFFSKIGFSLSLTRLLVKIKSRLAARVVITMHEVYEPVDPRRPWRWPIALLQRLQYLALLRIADQVIFVTPVFLDRVGKSQPWAASKVNFVPVFSNVPVVPLTPEERNAERLKRGLSPDEIVLGVLSKNMHRELRLEQLVETAVKLREKGKFCRLYFLGSMMPQGIYRKKYINRYAWDRGIQPLWSGSLSASDLSKSLQTLDYYVSLSREGISPRSSAFMAALAHNAGILCGPSPEMASFSEFENTALIADPLEPGELCSRLVSEAQEGGPRSESRLAARQALYRRYFTNEKIMEKIEQIYSKAGRD